MFYFFFESRSLKNSDPVVLWMTGEALQLIWFDSYKLVRPTYVLTLLQAAQAVRPNLLSSTVSCTTPRNLASFMSAAHQLH